jgi:hypothetical protein
MKVSLGDIVIYRFPMEPPKLPYDVPGIVHKVYDDERYAGITIFGGETNAPTRLNYVFSGAKDEEGTWRFKENAV